MDSLEPEDLDFDEPPPRPATPPVRKGFLLVLSVLTLATLVVYGVPYVADRTGYAWEAGRARAASEALAKLDKAGIVDRAGELFRMATAAVSPAVVNIQSQRLRKVGEDDPGLTAGGGRFGMTPGFQGIELGSGVIIDKAKGYIVTNYHVVKDADRIVVRLGRGEDVLARLVGVDPKVDIAVIKVKSELKVQAEWGDSDKLDIGDWVLAIGSPMGFDHSVTAGIVSATERNDVRISEYESYIQTDAAINPGNSGGPLINLAGKVIGINTAIITQTGAYEGIGLAIPSSLARKVAESLIKEGRVVRGYLGVKIQAVTPELARQLKLPNNDGTQIIEIQPGGPAEQAGLMVGDVIVKLGEKSVTDPASLRILTIGQEVGSRVPLEYYRDGQVHQSLVTVSELPPAPEVIPSLGLSLKERPAEGSESAAVEIDQVIVGSPAFRAGLRPRMLILGVGKERVANLAELENAVRRNDPRQGLPLLVQTPDHRVAAIRIGGQTKTGGP